MAQATPGLNAMFVLPYLPAGISHHAVRFSKNEKARLSEPENKKTALGGYKGFRREGWRNHGVIECRSIPGCQGRLTSQYYRQIIKTKRLGFFLSRATMNLAMARLDTGSCGL